jgi:hypothetical protein
MQYPHGVLDSERLNALQLALYMACRELGIREDDNDSRKRLAMLMTTLARAGQGDYEQLKSYAVYHFRHSKTS